MQILRDKVVMVTGGGGGIGSAIALRLAREGARLSIVDYSRRDLELCVSRLEKEGFKAAGFKADMGSENDVQTVFEKTEKAFGGVHVLVNAAGIQGPIGLAGENPVEEWKRTIEINLLGTYLCMRRALSSMMRNKSGKIINFSGGGSTSPRVRFSAYAAAKTAVVRLTETAAEEYRPFGIDVNAIAPGAVNTGMLDALLNAGKEAAGGEYEEALLRKEKGGTPPETAAELVLFLASGESNGITGKLISAPWDPWRDKAFQERLRTEKDLATLRRIDGRNFAKI
jgi:NAD(P)-dependent dehydrogenase (short-subunit alcohol dehydrogenase family)